MFGFETAGLRRSDRAPRCRRPALIRAATAALVLALAALAGAPGAGAATWQGPTGISQPEDAAGSNAQVTVGPYGQAAVAWWDSGTGGRVLLARHPPGAAWSAPVTIGTSGSAVTPLVAIDQAWTITAVWSDPNGFRMTIATWPLAAAAPSLSTLDQVASSTMAIAPIVVTQLAMNVTGAAFMVGESGANDVAFASRTSAADPFVLDIRAGGPQPARDPHVAVNETGAAVLVYRAGDSIYASRRASALGPLAPAETVNGGVAFATSPDELSVGLDRSGDALVGFSMLRGGSSSVGSAWSAPGGPWTAQWPLSPFGTAILATVRHVKLVVDPAGAAFIAWRQAGDGSELLRSYVVGRSGSSVTGTWGPAEGIQNLPALTSDAMSLPSPAFSGDSVAVVWDSQDPNGSGLLRAVARVRAPDGSWSNVQPLGPYGLSSSPTVASDGSTVVAAQTTTSGTVLASVLDRTPPEILFGRWARKGHTGEAISFATHASDTWSDPVITWSFGDGTSSIGATTTHVYARAGVYLVGASASDAVGNSAGFRPDTIVISAQRTTLTAQLHAVWRRSRLTGELVLGGTVPRDGSYTLDVTHGNGQALVRSFQLPAGRFARSVTLPPTLVPGRYLVALEPPVPATQVKPASQAVRLDTPAGGVIDRIALTRSGATVRARIHFVARATGRLSVTWWLASHGRRRVLARASKAAAFMLTSTARLGAAHGRVTVVVSRAGVEAAERTIAVP
jgi:hypothetical protein